MKDELLPVFNLTTRKKIRAINSTTRIATTIMIVPARILGLAPLGGGAGLPAAGLWVDVRTVAGVVGILFRRTGVFCSYDAAGRTNCCREAFEDA